MNTPSDFFSVTRPIRHGEIYLEPRPSAMVDLLQGNHTARQSTDIRIAGQTLNTLRDRCRLELLELVQSDMEKSGLNLPGPIDKTSPLVVTGHQCEFIHCGVFIKYILLSHLARQSGVTALNLVVDSDIPKNCHLAVPVGQDNDLEVARLHLCQPIPDLPMEYQPLPTPKQIEAFIARLKQLTVEPKLNNSIELLTQELYNSYQYAQNLVDLLTGLNHRIARQLDIDWLDLPVSLMARSISFAEFAADMICRPRHVFQNYNNALATFRQREKIKDLTHPMPDLACYHDDTPGSDMWEMPFWIVQPGCQRRPLYVKNGSNTLSIDKTNKYGICLIVPKTDSSPRITPAELSTLLKSCQIELRPRALTLTIFARVFLADYFIHGIGGAYYDLVADNFIRHFYGMSPPAYACTSATMHLHSGSIPSVTQIKENLKHLEYQQRDLQYNPQRYIDEPHLTPEIRMLLDRRNKAVVQSRHLKQTRASHLQRKDTFNAIRKINADLTAATQHITLKIAKDKERGQHLLHQSVIAHDREYYFGLFEKDDLKILQSQLNCPSNRSGMAPGCEHT